MRFPRSSGILLHISSLPGASGIGDLGDGAIRFVDFLEHSAQKVWQVLPLGPPALGNSPYSCYSAFAGNGWLVSAEQMQRDGWLDSSDLVAVRDESPRNRSVDYDAVAESKDLVLRHAFDRSRSVISSDASYRSFCEKHAWWLDDFARFESLMRHFGEPNWAKWPTPLVKREPEELRRWDDRLSEQIEYSKFVQFVFDQQFHRLKHYANQRGIKLFGDMPIFVAHQSADVWANQELFWLDDHGLPECVAGVPPDYFSETGQLWGNPLYRWEEQRSTDYQWWTARFERALEQFDLLRVDHFRGFQAYWEVPATASSAAAGRWVAGPKAEPFQAAESKLGRLPIVAEDLGLITDEVHRLRDQLGFPAMRVMQFGFESTSDVYHHPHHYPEHSVAYTGTHDNDTIMGWFAMRQRERTNDNLLMTIINGHDEIHFQLIKAVLDSASDTTVIPMQDLLGLGNDARMNVPGQPNGNWQWRAETADFGDALAAKLRGMTLASGR